MDFIMSSDDLYFQHLLVAAYSLFESQDKNQKITLHILENKVSNENKSYMNKLLKQYTNVTVIYYDASHTEELIGQKVNTEITINTYLRLFISEVIDISVKRILYIDVDVLVRQDLSELFKLDLGEKMIAGVKSTQDLNPKKNYLRDEAYINGGVALLDLEKLRKENIVEKYLEIIRKHNGYLKYHDQTIMNEAFEGKVYYLDLKYNVTSPVLVLKHKRLLKLYGLTSESYYDKEQYKEARENPKIIHMTGWVIGRPWLKGSRHPYKKIYEDYLDRLAYTNRYNTSVNGTRNRICLWIYKYMPVCLVNSIKQVNSILKKKILSK